MADIQFEGIGELQDRINLFTDQAKLEQALQKACALVERAAKEKAPKGNGDLRRSIASRVENLEGIVYTPLEYAPYVEYGTGLFAEGGNGRKDVPWSYQDDKGEWHTTEGMQPMPYLRPALDENRAEVMRIIKGGITDA
jgi:HK97 gp10 family phage protein